MSHRYNTRFQAKQLQAKQPEAKQLQAKQPEAKQPEAKQPEAKQPEAKQRQSVASQTDVVQDKLELLKQQERSSAVVNYFLARVAVSTSFSDKMFETIKLFEHLYEHPVLLTTHLRMKDTVWHKMAQLDKEMTDVLMRIPSTLDIDLHVLNTRTTIAHLHNLMNMIRQKYY